MQKTLIYSDVHIDRTNIEELGLIFQEILSYKADRVICLGDYYDRKLLTSEELIFGTSVMKKFVDKYKEVIMIEGNHDRETIKYLIDLGVKVTKNIVIDNNYYGHFFVEESIKAFNSAKRTLKELENYNYVFLGHQHSFQVLSDKRIHPGSILWCDFGEVNDNTKNIIILENDKINIIDLKSPIPMIDVFKKEQLKDINTRTKVRYVIKDFKQLKRESDKLEEYRNRFWSFKIKLDFENKEEEIEITPKKNIDDIVKDWINKIEDVEVKQELELTFQEER